MKSQEYVLGNDQEELDRLQLQHLLWRDELLKLWKHSKLGPYQKVLDLGCGPGFTSFDLLEYTENKIELSSVDLSLNFLEYLKKKAFKKNQNIKTYQSFIEDLSLPEKNFDFAFCRWLMIFVHKPDLAIQKIYEHLKPKAQFVIQEYVNYDNMNLVPNSIHIKKIVEATFKSWKDQGGDPNRGQVLPSLLEKSGFRVLRIEPIARFARPHEPLWQWPDSFYRSFLPRLVKSHYLTSEESALFLKEWEEAKSDPGAFFIAPTVMNIIAEKN